MALKKTGWPVEKNWSVWNGGSGPGSQFLFQDTLPPGWAGAEISEQKSFVLLMFLLSKIAHSAREGGQAAALGQSRLEKKLAEVGCRKKTGAWRTGNRQSQSRLE